MMMIRFVNAHEPALSPQEAAMLPAMCMSGSRGRTFVLPRNEADFLPVAQKQPAENTSPARSTLMPRSSLMMPDNRENFCPVASGGERAAARTAEAAPLSPVRGGSVAGRAVLSSEGIVLPGVARMSAHRRRIRRGNPDIATEYDYL